VVQRGTAARKSKINFREILEVARLSIFATKSAKRRLGRIFRVVVSGRKQRRPASMPGASAVLDELAVVLRPFRPRSRFVWDALIGIVMNFPAFDCDSVTRRLSVASRFWRLRYTSNRRLFSTTSTTTREANVQRKNPRKRKKRAVVIPTDRGVDAENILSAASTMNRGSAHQVGSTARQGFLT
jgi:hypothetical protein